MPRSGEDVERRHRRACERIEAGATDELDWAALGYTIHNVYGAIESYCLRIAKFFENDLDRSSWHRDLLGRMTLDIRGVRPAFLAREAIEPIEELRAFRRLDPAKVGAVQRHVEPALTVLRGSHASYCETLRKIAANS